MTATQVLTLDLWEPTPPPTDLIFDDGEPLESNRHRIAMNTLIDAYHQYRGEATDYFVGGNMFIYYSSNQVRNRDYRGPDFFVALDVDGTRSRQGWVVWEEGGRYPNMIVEFLSASTEAADRGPKKEIYERIFKCRNYFIYDPFKPESLEGWELINETYQPLVKDERSWLWSSALGLWLGPWSGERLKENAVWLRFYDGDGKLVPLPHEAEQERANQAEYEKELECQRANHAEYEKELERQRANQAQQEAQDQAQQAQQLRAQLLALGLTPHV